MILMMGIILLGLCQELNKSNHDERSGNMGRFKVPIYLKQASELIACLGRYGHNWGKVSRH